MRTRIMENNDNVNICKLTQAEANNILKTLSQISLQNFNTAFDTEHNNMLMRQWESDKSVMIMLPPEERLYFLIKVNGKKYLLIGISSQSETSVNISSIASINQEIKGKAVHCLKKLIEDELVPMAIETNKRSVNAYAYSKRSWRVFDKLSRLGIKGISEALFEGRVFKGIL